LKIRRTANAGILLEADGLSILIDGVSGRVEPYMETPPEIKEELIRNFPDVVLFTHEHPDHYDGDFAKFYKEKTLRSVYGPEVLFSERFGSVNISNIPTRHIGKFEVAHTSFIIEGSKCVWFMGDASPLDWKKKDNLPAPDVIVAPFAYANTSSVWKMMKEFGAEYNVIVHMPEKNNDPYGLWDAVKNTVGNDSSVLIPIMGETLKLKEL